jgi:hypothetical protein
MARITCRVGTIGALLLAAAVSSAGCVRARGALPYLRKL